jgi:hypothetical protein
MSTHLPAPKYSVHFHRPSRKERIDFEKQGLSDFTQGADIHPLVNSENHSWSHFDSEMVISVQKFYFKITGIFVCIVVWYLSYYGFSSISGKLAAPAFRLLMNVASYQTV